VVDVTSAWSCIGLAGPRAHDLLAAASGSGLESGDDLRWLEVGYASALLLPWLGPDGRRLLVSTDSACAAFDGLWAHRERFGLRCAGSMAADALAIRHGAPRFGAEATPFCPAVAAGLDGCLNLEANASFIGRDAVLRARGQQTGALRRFTADARDLPPAHAPVMRDGTPVGHVTGSAFIPSLGKSMVWVLLGSAGETGSLALQGAEGLLPLAPYQ
jgi:glycine cleavage system aminomethyltransferase T